MTNTPSVKPSFFSELRRRRVFRVIGVYAGAGFALLEFVDIVAPILQLPTWSTTLVLALLGIGFPIAAILAWIFDITPDGLVRTSKETDSLPQHKPFTSNIIIGVLIIIILGLLIFPKIQGENSTAETPSIAIMLIENIGDQADEFWTRGITEDVIIELARGGILKVTPIKEILQYADSELTLGEIAQKLGVRYLLTSSLFKSEESFDFRTQLIETGSGKSIYANKWSEPVERASAIPGALAENILTELNLSPGIEILNPVITDPEAYEYYLKGRYRHDRRKNLEDTEIARGLFVKALELDSLFVKARIELGIVYSDMGEYDQAEKIFNECIQISRSIGDKLGEASVLNSLGQIYISRGRYDDALNFCQESLELNQVPGGSRVKAHTLNTIGMIKYRRGKNEEALQYYNESLQIRRDIGNRSLQGYSLTNIGNVYKNLGDNDKALEFYNQALTIAQDLDEEPTLAILLNNLGNIYLDDGEYDRALESYGQALEIKQNIGDRREAARTMNNIAGIHIQRGEYAKAINLVKETLQIRQDLGDQPGVMSSHAGLGYIYLMMDEFDQALEYIRIYNSQALASGEKGAIGVSYTGLGEVYYLLDMLPKAIESFQSANEVWKELEQTERYIVTLSSEALAHAKNNDLDVAHQRISELQGMLDSTVNLKEGEIILNWNLSQVHTLLGDKDIASEHLKTAHAALTAKAMEILIKSDRETFLNSTRENRQILAAWEAVQGDE